MAKAAADPSGTPEQDDLDQDDLLEDEDEDLDDSDDDLDDDDSDDESDDEDDDAEDQDAEDGNGKKAVRFDEAALLKKVESRIDRRLNAVLREVRKGREEPGTQRRQGTSTGRPARREAAPVADVRGARLAFRDYLPDEVKITSTEERKFATDLGRTMIEARAAKGFEDEDVVGREVAEEVAKQVKGLRKHYQTRTVAALRRRGALPDTKGGQGPAGSTGGKGAADSSQFTDGANLAAQRHARPASQKV